MKKAIKISSIIYIPVLAFMLFLGFIFGLMLIGFANNPELISQLASDYAYTEAQISAVLTTYGATLIVYACSHIPGLVIDIIILTHINKESAGQPYSKAHWIVLGALGYFFGAVVPGVLSFVWAFVRKNSDFPNSNVQEVHFEEKKEETPKASDYDAPDHL